jgi:hypothetical protein
VKKKKKIDKENMDHMMAYKQFLKEEKAPLLISKKKNQKIKE